MVALLVGSIFERHPAVAGLGEGAHHLRIQRARRDLLFEKTGFFGSGVGPLKIFAELIGQVGDLLRIEEAPLPVFLDALHEEVGNPVGDV